MSADELKAQGNAAFAAKDFPTAIDHFSKAIEASPTPNHVLYSNRSACHSSLKNFDDALKDAQSCIDINPQWAKGYGRKGAALHGKGDLIGAKDAYEEGLKLDPANAQNKSGLESVERAIMAEAQGDGTTPDMGLGDMFSNPANLAKLAADPEVKEYMKDPEFVKKLGELQKNPMAALSGMQQDPRLMKAMALMLGIPTDMQGKAAEDKAAHDAQQDVEMKDAEPAKPAETPKAAPKTETKAAEPVSDEKKQADEEKALGNTAYKAHKFDEAIAHYNKAYSIHEDITYLNNRAAAEFEKGDYETCIKTCEEAITKGREVFADYKILAKSFSRCATAYAKMDNLPKAIELYNRALTEHRTPDTLSKLRAAEKELKTQETQAYIDPAKAEEAREEGKEKFAAGDWPGAVKAYTEMIKRAPENPIGYSNRAAALAKLMSFPEAVVDCDAAISKDPTFIRAYIRKANAYFAMREYSKCVDTCTAALEHDKEGKSKAEIEALQYKAMSARFQAQEGETPEETMERASKDPEIVQILQDPIMSSILNQARENPAALQDHMKNPEVARKVQLLVAAGIIRTR
ncbi:Hsp70-Hsp90 organizing protein 1 [Yarrowia sp. C11]|nr:Hsp70-Hsp90 organizing protein 1 [Yarrowia sp. E02]KAG5373375.1 Hsp70-Hsp90 organizing protein 1 [Yarrowia sp. C11]